MRFLRNWKLSIPTIALVLVGLGWLAFGYFGVHTAFIDDRVDEAAPVFDAVPTDDASVPAESPFSPPVVAEAPSDTGGAPEPATPVAAVEETPAPVPTVESSPPEPTSTAVVTEYAGDFTPLSRYTVVGSASVLGNGTDQRFLRFEAFESNNGPDLNVYLVDPDDPNDFVDLGDLKGNIGDQNYEIPADVDLDRYSRVSIWCVRFSTGFGQADLVAIGA